MVTDDDELKEMLLSTKVIATVGASTNDEKPSYWIFAYLKAKGYRMIPVNPNATELQGEQAYPDLASVPVKVDVVQVFRRPEDVPPIAEDAIRIGAKVLWLQKGIINHEAERMAEAAGLKVVMDRCMREAHERAFGVPLSWMRR
jgi:predicted CoA-binding protein